MQVGKKCTSLILLSLSHLVGRNCIMARTANLTNMDVTQLLELRKQIDATLMQKRGDLEKQLRELGTLTDGATTGRGRRGASALKGRKVAAKYRGPSGELWAGRGAKPRWLVAAMKDGGKKLEDFLIEKSTEGGRRKTKRRKN
jgi:DNA-binding protein H-NS